MAGAPVRPSMSRRFYICELDHSLALQMQLVDDDKKFTRYAPQGATWAAANLTELEKAYTFIEKWRRLVSGDRFPAIELNSRSNMSNPL